MPTACDVGGTMGRKGVANQDLAPCRTEAHHQSARGSDFVRGVVRYSRSCGRVDHSSFRGERSHVRADQRRRRQVLGIQRVGQSRRRNHDAPPDSGGRFGSHERGAGDRCGRRSHLRPHDGRRRQVLGIQRRRPARRRHHDAPPDSGGRLGSHERGAGDHRRERSHLRPHHGRRRQVLGIQRRRPARGRHQDRPLDPCRRRWPRDRGAGDHSRRVITHAR